jgi:hypothetical protein
MTNNDATTNTAPDWRKIGIELAAVYAARNATWDAVGAAGAMGSDAADEANEQFWRIMELINETPAGTSEGRAVKARAMRIVFAEELKGDAADVRLWRSLLDDLDGGECVA